MNAWKCVRRLRCTGAPSKKRSMMKVLPHPGPPCRYTPWIAGGGGSAVEDPVPNNEESHPPAAGVLPAGERESFAVQICKLQPSALTPGPDLGQKLSLLSVRRPPIFGEFWWPFAAL